MTEMNLPRVEFVDGNSLNWLSQHTPAVASVTHGMRDGQMGPAMVEVSIPYSVVADIAEHGHADAPVTHFRVFMDMHQAAHLAVAIMNASMDAHASAATPIPTDIVDQEH